MRLDTSSRVVAGDAPPDPAAPGATPPRAPAAGSFGRRLAILLLAGLALRLIFLPVAGSRQDNLYFQQWGDSAAAEGLGGLYTRPALALNYPPAYLYLLAADGWLHAGISRAAGRPWPPATLDPAFFMLQKLNPIAADLLTAGLLGLALRRRLGARPALTGAAAWALNPALIYTAGYWGQVDGIVLGLLVAAFLAGWGRRPGVAGRLLGLAVATKAQALLFVPVLAVFVAVRAGRQAEERRAAGLARAGGAVALGAALPPLALAAPFWLGGAGAGVLAAYTQALGHFTLVALNAFNGWWLVYGEGAGGMDDGTVVLAGLTAREVGLALLALGLLGLAGLYLRALRRLPADGAMADLPETEAGALAWGLAALLFFLLPTQVHERYALYVLPALVLAALFRVGGAAGAWRLAWLAAGLIWLNLFYIVPLLPLPRPVGQVLGEVGGRAIALAWIALAIYLAARLSRLGRSAGAGRAPAQHNAHTG